MNKQNDLVTKSYLKEELGNFGERLKKELKQEIKSDLLEIKDEIIKEIKDMREEQEVHQASHVRINDELEEHEEKIIRLEQKPVQ